MLRVKINGKEHLCEARRTVLGLLKSIGNSVPALCYDSRLHPSSSCRLCSVKINGSSSLHPACSTLLADGMEIETHSDEIEGNRRNILRMLAKRYPLSAVKEHGHKEFHKWLKHYGITEEMQPAAPGNVDDSHPYMRVDMSRCILCHRCVQICDSVQGQFVWHVVKRGDESLIIPDSKGLLGESSCVSCGACADTCPTGAIEDKNILHHGLPEKTVNTVCPYCGVGCEIAAGVKDNRITGVHPVLDSPVSRGHLCVKGRYAWSYLYANERITHPVLRYEGGWKQVTWKEAIRYCAQKLKSISRQYGPDSIGILASARATNEDNYLIQKFARAVIGTNNVDCCARVCHQPTAKAMSMALGTGAATNSFDDIEKARTILIAGTNTTENHPVVGARIKQRVLNGSTLIVIDPRKIELAHYAKYHLQLKPGTNIPLFNAMAHVIVEEGLYDREFVKNRTAGWEAFRKFITEWPPERAEAICHVPATLIRQAARTYAKESPSMCFHGLGITEHTQGTEGVLALVNLALLTGNIGKPGSGINPLRGQNNVQGAAAMGCDPAVFTGMASVRKDKMRFEDLWKTPLPGSRGFTLPEMLDAAFAGSLKCLWITGYDVFFTMPDVKHVKKAFENLDCLIVQDMFMNETASRFADVFLPAAASFEKEGTFMNSERRIQKIRKAVPAPSGAKADWEIVCALAAEMGKGNLFSFSNAEEIWNEIRRAWGAVNGITYSRLENGGIQWPCPDVSHPGTPILHTEAFSFGDRARLFPVDFKPSAEKISRDYPLLLVTGRELYHFNAGTMTYNTANKTLRPTDFLHVHPADAEKMKLRKGERVKLISRYGDTVIPVKIDDAVNIGELFTTFNHAEVFVNTVIGPYRDSYVQTPEYKVTAVRIEKIKS